MVRDIVMLLAFNLFVIFSFCLRCDSVPERSTDASVRMRLSFSGKQALSDDILVDIQALHFNYDGRPVLQGINMRIPRGKVVAIMGGSGCG